MIWAVPSFTTQQLSEHVGGELRGPADIAVTGVNQLDGANRGDLTFIRTQAFAAAWPACGASAALVNRSVEVEPGPGRAFIVVDDADLAMAAALDLFAPPPVLPGDGVHPTAVVDPSAQLGDAVRIGPYTVIGAHAVIGDRTVLHAHVTVLDHTRIGADCTLWPGVVVRDRCTIGDRCIIHPNASIGADGFNYRPQPDGSGLRKIPQIGTVQIEDDVEIGANTCVDRGKFAATVIGTGSKIDNLCQIAHNCRIGRHAIVAGGCMIAGSATIEDGAVVGGSTNLRDHMTIGAGAMLAASSNVITDVPPGEVWGGYVAHDLREVLREMSALRKLPELVRKMRKL
jgi:UDP-3-O-[3-hydroxymyristoyl] glucosamine N-acyltransferase